MTDSNKKTRIAVLDAHVLYGECLCLALTLRGHEALQIPVPARTTGSTALLAVILRKRPDVAILDIELGTGWDAGTLVQGLARSRVHVVVVTEVSDPVRWGEALAHGARLVLSKDAPLSTVTSAMRRLNDRVPLMTPEQRRGMLEAFRDESRVRREERARLETLTTRESEILDYLIAGMAASDIAAMCVVSEATVRTQIKAVLAKLEVRSQIAAVGMAHHIKWHPRDFSTGDHRKRHRIDPARSAGAM